MMQFCDLALPGVSTISPYVPGKPIEALQREMGLDSVVKLASNESPIGVSPRVQEALVQALADLTRYPDGTGYRLKMRLARQFNIDPAQLTLGNGSNDVLECVARTFVSPSCEVIYSEFAFAVYGLVTQAIGAKAVVVPAKAYGHDLDAMQQAITAQTKLVFIANPNNPTGTCVDDAALYAFLASVPHHVLVVLDEAYVEYRSTPSPSLSWLDEFPNLIISRTFSKAYGLAGLRVGFAVSHPDIADLLNRVRQPFNVNALALIAAEAALEDLDYVERARAVNQAGLVQIIEGLSALGLACIRSHANFVCVDLGQEAMPIYEQLLRRGVIVRPIAAYGLPNHLRISIGLEAENARFLESLSACLAQSS